MLSNTYSRIDPTTPAAAEAPAPTHRLGVQLGRRTELGLAFTLVVLASSACWAASSWVLANWQLH